MNKVTPVSLGYPLSVCNKNTIFERFCHLPYFRDWPVLTDRIVVKYGEVMNDSNVTILKYENVRMKPVPSKAKKKLLFRATVRTGSSVLPVARGGSGAPLAARPFLGLSVDTSYGGTESLQHALLCDGLDM